TGGVYSGNGVSGTLFDFTQAGIGLHTVYYTYADTNNCSKVDSTHIQVVECTSAGVTDSIEEGLTIFPNPASESITIRSKSNSNQQYGVEIYDLMFRKLYVAPLFKDVQVQYISVNDWDSGVIFLTIR